MVVTVVTTVTSFSSGGNGVDDGGNDCNRGVIRGGGINADPVSGADNHGGDSRCCGCTGGDDVGVDVSDDDCKRQHRKLLVGVVVAERY